MSQNWKVKLYVRGFYYKRMFLYRIQAKLTAEIAELQKRTEERKSQRSLLASVDGDVSMASIAV